MTVKEQIDGFIRFLLEKRGIYEPKASDYVDYREFWDNWREWKDKFDEYQIEVKNGEVEIK